MTFNIRYDNLATWPLAERRDRHRLSVLYDLLGFQEVLSHQMDDLVAGLPRHDSMAWAGTTGAPGKPVPSSESGPLRAHPRRDPGLSPTPKEVGSIGWDAELPRIATVVVLHDRQTGKVFRIINAHFSHIGEVAREASARMLMRMAGTADVNLLMGDLNAKPGSPALEVLTGRLADAHDAARKRAVRRSGPIPVLRPPAGGASRIDHLSTEARSRGIALRNASSMVSTCLPTVYIALMP